MTKRIHEKLKFLKELGDGDFTTVYCKKTNSIVAERVKLRDLELLGFTKKEDVYDTFISEIINLAEVDPEATVETQRIVVKEILQKYFPTTDTSKVIDISKEGIRGNADYMTGFYKFQELLEQKGFTFINGDNDEG